MLTASKKAPFLMTVGSFFAPFLEAPKKTPKKHEDCLKITSKRPTGGIRKKNSQKGNNFFPNMSEKGPRKDPNMVPESINFRPFLAPSSAPETAKARFYWFL